LNRNNYTSAEVKEQLNRILAAEVFQNSKVLSQFLTFVVEEVLSGNGKQLKEYIIGLNVLSKKANFNPQTDPIVRIHAGRLRRTLNEYYNGTGKDDPIQITIPKGTYAPEFINPRSPESGMPIEYAEPADVIEKKTTIAVFPFKNNSTDATSAFFEDGLGDHLSTELSRYPELSVVSYYSCRKIAERASDVKEAGLLLDSKFIVTGTVQSSGEELRVRVQLILCETGEQLWGYSFERKSTISDLFSIQDDIVQRVISQIAGHYGVIFRTVSKIPSAKNIEDLKILDAIFWYYHYVNDVREDIFHKAIHAMRNSIQIAPEYALGWAVLGEIYIGGHFMGYRAENVVDMVEEALVCGKKAKKLDPLCQHAYQTMGLAYLFQQNRPEALKTINDWSRLKHKAAGIMGGMGFCLICCGEYEEGIKMLEESVHLNPYYQWWFNGGMSFYYFKKAEYADAIYWAEKMNQPQVAWEMIIKTASHVEMNNLEEAKKYASNLARNYPFANSHLELYINAFLQDKSLTRQLHQAVLKASAASL
jgi:TolB-like protein/Tfp pilus assembly protein PilF